MQMVDNALMYPTCCVLSQRTDGPLIDMLKFDEAERRQYVHPEVVDELTRFIGGLDRAQAAALQAIVDEQNAELEELRAIKTEFEELKDSVAKTLTYGPAYGGTSGKPQLRKRAPKASEVA